MRLPLAWLYDYLPEDLRGPAFNQALDAACRRWDLERAEDPAQVLGRLLTFAGFSCDAVAGRGDAAILELDVLSNRPDGQCVLGLAREVAAILDVPLRAPAGEIARLESGPPASELARVQIDEPFLCPRYTARLIRGVKIGPSPRWLRERLEWMGLQPRNNVVDVTNFICFELNQPLHAFDLNTLAGRQIVVRRARAGEFFAPLYGEIPPLTSETLVIADAQNARAIAGVLGGKGSEVSPQTTDILLEAAYFNPANTRRTVRRLKIMDGRGTDSSYRFERGIDLEGVAQASARAAGLIVELAGGAVVPGLLDAWPQPRAPKTLALRYGELERKFGAPVPRQTAARVLSALGCRITAEEPERITVQVPSWRRGDLEREIDLIEEVARLYGYNHVPETTAMTARVPPRSPAEVTAKCLRGLFTALGYFETVSDSLVDPRWPAPAVWTAQAPLRLDPSSVLREDHSALRTSLLASLLAVRRYNQDQRTGEARLFEIGKVFLPRGKGDIHLFPPGAPERSAGRSGKEECPLFLFPEERTVLGLLDDRAFPVLADTVLRIGAALELDSASVKLAPPNKDVPPFLDPAQACQVIRVRLLAGQDRAEEPIGWLGALSSDLQKDFALRKGAVMCEIDLAALASLPTAPARYTPLSALPEIVRDTALVVAEGVAWSEIAEFARHWQAREPLRDPAQPPRFLSVFRGAQAGSGKKSVAFSVVYRAPDRTLTDEEVNAAHTRFQQALLEKFKGTLRV